MNSDSTFKVCSNRLDILGVSGLLEIVVVLKALVTRGTTATQGIRVIRVIADIELIRKNRAIRVSQAMKNVRITSPSPAPS